jgi:hypothetical protein
MNESYPCDKFCKRYDCLCENVRECTDGENECYGECQECKYCEEYKEDKEVKSDFECVGLRNFICKIFHLAR